MINKYKYIAIILLSMTLFSCSKKLLYLNDLQPDQTLPINYTNYKLKPYDYLYINIRTTDQEVNKLFSQFLKDQITNNINPNFSNSNLLFSYMINDSGYIYLPLFGQIKAAGLTVEQFEKKLQSIVNSILTNSVVKVRLVSFRVYFIGEVNTSIILYKNHVNILEAISRIGGIPYSADKRHVYVLRRQDSVYKIFTLDLTTKNVIKNKNFFLQPNDIIYFKPRKISLVQLNIKDYFIFASAISSVLSVTTLIITLINLKK